MRITLTIQLDSKHDWRAVRRLLKRLLRGYGLRCIALQTEADEGILEKQSTNEATNAQNASSDA